MHDLAIIIVSFNSAEWLRPCLSTVFAQAGEIDLDVVVADNESTDNTAELLESEFPAVRVVRTPNFGFSYANNRALMTCDARYVLFLNPDTEIVEGTFAELIAALDSRPEVGLAGVRHLTDGRIYPSMRRFPNALRALGTALGIERSPYRPAWSSERVLERDPYERETDCDWTVGAFMVARHEALEGAGSFDERFFLYSEEPDLCRRIKQGGWAVRHLPQMTIIHHAGKAKLNPRMEAQNAYSRLQYARKHFSPAHRATYRLMLILEHALRWTLARARGDRPRRSVAARVVATLTGRDEPPFGPSPAVAVSRRDPVGSVDRPRAR